MAISSWMYIVFWITMSCVMILFNKAVLDQLKFPFPMFLVFWHMTLATILTQIMSRTTNMLKGVKEGKVTMEVITNQVIPLSFLFAMSLVLSNKAYIYLAVSYIQMLKAFMPVAVLIFSFVAGIESPSYMEVGIVSIICVGVALTSAGESFFSWTGFTFQALGILAESSRLVLTGLLMQKIKLDPLSNLYYVAPCCMVFTGIACLVFESADLPYERMQTMDFMMIMLVNGSVAFTLNIAVVALITNTSPLVLTLAGIIKDILLVVLSVSVFGSPVTPLQYAGYGVALLGLNLHKEYKKQPERIGQLITYMMSCGMAKAV